MLSYNQLKEKFFIIAGPNVIESEAHVLFMANQLKEKYSKYNVNFIFKVSFDKANRTSLNSYRGVSFEEGLRILKKVKEEVGVPIITDIHESWQAKPVAEVADILQIPAFLCRQTDLLKAAAETGRILHVKKGQFASADVMHKTKEKLIAFGNPNVILCERGNSFGYQDLVVDPRNLVWLKSSTNLVSMDITHCLQQPAQKMADGTVQSGGLRELIPYMGKMAVSLGVDGVFMEVHDRPDESFCDAPTQWPLDKLDWLLEFMGVSKALPIILPENLPNKSSINKSIAAFVCIKLNNTRLPNKNILDLNNKPLCYWIFDKLKKVKNVDKIYVYCSDETIKNYIPEDIIFIKRDKKFDSNETKANELLKSFAEIVKSDYYLLCHATCPYLKVSTIQEIVDDFNPLKNGSAFTAKKFQTFLWQNNKPLNFSLNDIPRTQDMDPFYIENIGAYLYSYEDIMIKHRRVGENPLIVNVSDIECVDVDYKEDYEFAKTLESEMLDTYN